MRRVGITGQNGFVGSHLYRNLKLHPEEFECVDFRSDYFESAEKLDEFVSSCDVIVHLAAKNRDDNEQVIYDTNLDLVQKLVASLERTKSHSHVLMSSSTQEERDNLYGRSKREGRTMLANWATRNRGTFTGLIIPNVFGAFGKPFYNSFIATFCYQLTHGETPTIAQDNEVKLIFVQELVNKIIDQIRENKSNLACVVEETSRRKVSEILNLLESYTASYFKKGEIPILNDKFEHDLFNTYRSYIDHKSHYPVKFKKHSDNRGAFVELIRLGIGGQCSFSTTREGVTRGNHYHTRKIERFAVIKGKALIQLRKVGTDEVLDFYLDGTEPAYVDMPIWYTHNIKNVGEEELYTVFWINEPFNPDDADTYFENV